jgi:hypothetical protein
MGGVVALWVKYPATDGSRLIGHLVEVIIGDIDSPDGLLGSLAEAVAVLVKYYSNGSNFLCDAHSFDRFGFPHGWLDWTVATVVEDR